MAQQLWLLRHGEAVPHDSKPDAERELTARGERQAVAAGAALARLGLEFAGCFTSPKVRARDTARLACEALNVEPVETRVLGDGFDADAAAELLRGTDDPDARLLLVGHDPDLTRVVRDLSGARVDFKKGGVVALQVKGRGATLVALLRPRELQSLGFLRPASPAPALREVTG